MARPAIARCRLGVLTVAVVLAAVGCGRSTDGPAAPTAGDPTNGGPPLAAATESAPGEPGSGTGNAVDEADLTAVLAELTQAVRRFGLEQRRAPASLEDLVAKGYLGALPEAPRGARFVIDKQLQVRLEQK